jgi:hypothetical protein
MRTVTIEKILRRIGQRAARLIARLLFLKRGGYRGPFGSFISPAAQTAANSEELYRLITPIMKAMTTRRVREPLVRLGSEFDGGYVVLKKDYSNSFLISAGISNNNDFEKGFAEMGGHAHQVDYTVEGAPKKHPNLTFERSRVVGEYGKSEIYDVTLDDLYNNFIKNTSYEAQENILKMDIEGSEWEILDTSLVLHKFDQILLEIHYLERFANEKFQVQYMSAMNKLFKNFFPVAIAGNNCCGFVTVGGYSVPRVLEMTLLNKNNHHFENQEESEDLTSLLTRNYPNRAPVVLKRW